MEIDNVIYIVLIIAIFVVSLLGQIRKKKLPGPVLTNDEVKYSLNDFEKILERKQEYQKIEETTNNIEESNSETQIEDTAKNADIHPKDSKNNNKKEENEIDDGFDIKSAIIYSSILERKKFRH